MTDIGPGDRATLHAIASAARDAPPAHAGLPPAHQRQGRGWVLHMKHDQRYERSGAEQLGHDEQGET